ncbi:MAG: hypothetical protein JHC93_04840 [Parachlamydiales bacterium]|nr:hypothetical protein [Parachlamydiales bacterium]
MKRFALFAVIGMIAAMTTLVLLLFTETKADHKAYQDLNTQINNQPKGQTTQQRYCVRKDIYFSEGLKRKHILMLCPTAELFFASDKDQSTALEKMQKVRCWMQEEFIYELDGGQEAVLQPNGKYLVRHANVNEDKSWIEPSIDDKPFQIIRYFEADEATYDYTSHLFWANNTPISRFRSPSHILLTSTVSSELLMKGFAKEAQFDLHGKDVSFHLQKLKATFFDTTLPEPPHAHLDETR